MEFMDLEQRKRYGRMLIVGYVLVGILILLISIILVYVVHGYWYSNGQVIQNGLVSLSSVPGSASVYVDGSRYKNDTTTSILLPAGSYALRLHRSGYRDWQHLVAVGGDQVENYNYPLLFPVDLKTVVRQDYVGKPMVMSGSIDQRWLLVSQAGSLTTFDVYDLNNPAKASTVAVVPSSLLHAGNSQALSVVEWADDNRHVLLKHTYDSNVEYIILDRSAPSQSVNLTETLHISAQNMELSLINQKYDHYLVYDVSAHLLLRANLSVPQPQPYRDKVLAYSAYGDNFVLYATPSNASDKVDINLYDGSHSYTIRRAAAKTTYLLDLAQYNGDLFVAIAASSENAVYIYDDPISQVANKQSGGAVPIRVLHLAPTYLAFAPKARYVVAEAGNRFAVFNAENQQSTVFSVSSGLDAPQLHATWMDNSRLLYVSGGKLVVLDYDGTNTQTLVAADANYVPVFDQDYRSLYALTDGDPDVTHERLTNTALRTPADSGSIFPAVSF